LIYCKRKTYHDSGLEVVTKDLSWNRICSFKLTQIRSL